MVTKCSTSPNWGSNIKINNDFPIDHNFESLVAPSVYDATAQEILEALFNAFSTLISRLLADHLPDGKYHNPSGKLIVEMKYYWRQ